MSPSRPCPVTAGSISSQVDGMGDRMRSRFLVVLFRPDEVPAELALSLERREAEKAGTYCRMSRELIQAGLPINHLAPGSLQHQGRRVGEYVCPQELHTCVQVSA